MLTCFDLLWQPLHWIWRYYLSLNLDWLHKNIFLFFSYHNHPHVPTAWQCSWAAIGVGGYLCGHNQLGSDLFHIFALMATYQLEFHVTSIFSKNQPILLVPSVTLPINSHFQKGRPFWRPPSCTAGPVAPWPCGLSRSVCWSWTPPNDTPPRRPWGIPGCSPWTPRLRRWGAVGMGATKGEWLKGEIWWIWYTFTYIYIYIYMFVYTYIYIHSIYIYVCIYTQYIYIWYTQYVTQAIFVCRRSQRTGALRTTLSLGLLSGCRLCDDLPRVQSLKCPGFSDYIQ